MASDSGNFFLEIKDSKSGKFIRKIKVNDLFYKSELALDLIGKLEDQIKHVDFKYMNGVKTSVLFNLAGLKDAATNQEKALYALFNDIVRLVDAVICDLGFDRVDMYKLKDTIKEIAYIFQFAKSKNNPSVLTDLQKDMIDSKFMELLERYNTALIQQIASIKANNNWIASVNSGNYFQFLYISSILNADYKFKGLNSLKFDLLQIEA